MKLEACYSYKSNAVIDCVFTPTPGVPWSGQGDEGKKNGVEVAVNGEG